MVRNDEVLSVLTEIGKDTAAIKQHLSDMNGSICRHEKEIVSHRKAINKVNIAVFGLGSAIVVGIIQSVAQLIEF